MTNVVTYIIETESKEYYVGMTINLEKRLIEHQKESYPHWFNSLKRKTFLKMWTIKGNYELKIKSFGIKKFIEVNKALEETIF
jgi:predicted GIY-YIG superfamily endonuclease